MKIRLLPALAAFTAALTIHGQAAAILRITEVMSNGDTADWFEVTNYGDTAADMTGCRMDDNSFSFALSVALNGATSIAPGESVVFIEGNQATADSFEANWGTPGTQVGYYSGSGVGFSSGGDGVVVFNSGGTQITPQTSFGAATSGTSFYWSYDSAGTLATAALGTLTTSTLPGYVTWLNGSTTMRGTPGVAVVSGAASFLYWKGGAGDWVGAGGTNWFPLGATNGAPWSSTNTAVFNTGSGTVNMPDAIVAKALQFDVGGYTLSPAGGALTLTEGNVAANAGTTTLAAALAGTNGLAKSGTGTLMLSGTNSYTGFTSVVQGTIRLGGAAAVPANSVLTTARFTTFDFNGAGLVAAGLAGVGSFANIGTELTINIAGGTSARLDGALSGDGDVIIDSDGTGAQRFDSTGQSRGDGLTKNYTGRTVVRRGLLEVDANGYPGVSGVPTETSEVVIEGTATNRGELTLTMDGGTYEFGVDLPQLSPITLDGGTLGNEASETVDLYNPVTVTGTGSIITSRGAGNGTNMFAGEFYLWGDLSGSGALRKSGAGILFLEGANSGFSGPWEVANGTLEVPAGITTGTGPVQLLRTTTTNGVDIGRLSGRGTVGGHLAIAGELDLLPQSGNLNVSGNVTMSNGGQLRLHLFGEPTPSVRVIATGDFAAAAGSSIAVAGTPAAGIYPVLLASGGVAGTTNIAVTGLDGSGLAGSASADGNTLVLVLAEDSGVTYASWSGGVPPDEDVNGNGFTALEEFGLGAAAPGAPFLVPAQGMTNVGGTNYLTLVANIRTNGAGLTTVGQSSTNLATGAWSTNGVSFIPTGATNIPSGCEQRLYRTPLTGSNGFLRLGFFDE
jgi:autotransporter-associated beta strand protein